MHVAGISCDLAKAPDCVNHELVLSTLKFFGNSKCSSYLQDRKQKVETK